jgi:hypothetical protein
VSLLLIE